MALELFQVFGYIIHVRQNCLIITAHIYSRAIKVFKEDPLGKIKKKFNNLPLLQNLLPFSL